jgi:fucose 4-O-acetylase-like acetyltransferase
MPNQPAKVRDPWFDNAKMALVTLVVVGHSWTLLPHNVVNDQAYDFLYFWHVPAFVFVTGYLSRTFTWSSTRLVALVRTVVVPYVVFETALALFRVYVGGEQLEDLFRDPHWPMWYLSALFFWRLMTPVFRPLRGGLLVAIVLSLVAGLWVGDTLDVARVLGLLPFFVLGLKATPERLALLRGRPPLKVAAVLTLVGLAVLAHWTDGWASTEWLYYRSEYAALESTDARAVLVRAALLVLGTVGAWAFLSLVPRVGGWFATMGSASLVVYLFHGFVVKGLEYSAYPDWAAAHPVLSLPLTTLGAMTLALVLASQPVARRLGVLVDPVGFAQAHVRHAMDLTRATEEAEEHAEALADAIAEAEEQGRPTPGTERIR